MTNIYFHLINFDKKAVTYRDLIFFVETFEKQNPWAPSQVAKVKGGRMVKEPDLKAEKIQVIRTN